VEPDTLGRLHPEEVEGPEGVLGRSPHAVEADLAAGTRREAVIAKDPHDGRLTHADAHPPQLLPDAPLAPSRDLALERDDQLGFHEREEQMIEDELSAPNSEREHENDRHHGGEQVKRPACPGRLSQQPRRAISPASKAPATNALAGFCRKRALFRTTPRFTNDGPCLFPHDDTPSPAIS
jgi:hypothetical protein